MLLSPETRLRTVLKCTLSVFELRRCECVDSEVPVKGGVGRTGLRLATLTQLPREADSRCIRCAKFLRSAGAYGGRPLSGLPPEARKLEPLYMPLVRRYIPVMVNFSAIMNHRKAVPGAAAE